ncbi:putative sterigmatocystin biosynthesis monooxygenase [Lachnellula hyalina]|uniref:Putative sterigmatocystin biosynthesis monooxygenase n=1 Tax=Lachnellula hyalina TaxID=1316788 RepID=A0A8H8TYQ4_9HELO|nr:putative sterigmatocystin biosynthesis monooxygenase [Lachnellula hyalina]TVY25630.1 putative sterigmatocystin biosynthesis monooxygenase [Lachnellula hyalina]
MASIGQMQAEGLGDPLYPENGDGPNYSIPKTWHSQKTKLRVACIGAGPSGLCLAYKMERQMQPGTWELTIYEKNPAEGGTWYENKYPGCACDIPAHIYTYSWDPQPDWSTFYAYSPEILEYFKKFSDKHDLHHYVQLNSQIISAAWNDQEGKYNLIIRNPQTGEEREDWSHVLVNATGNLNKWKWPEIEGLHDFAGPKMHSATWDESVDFKDKTVAIIGTGSTAIQIVPKLQKVAKKLELFMRSPTWISPPFGDAVLKEDVRDGKEEDMANRQYYFSEEEKRKFREDPEGHLFLRQKIEAEINLLFPFYTRGTPLQKKMHQQMRAEMEKRIGPGHDELKKNLIPEWLPGCRRITPGDGYLESLVKSNVNCVFQGIQKITPDGLIDDAGEFHPVDILVCATGVCHVDPAIEAHEY